MALTPKLSTAAKMDDSKMPESQPTAFTAMTTCETRRGAEFRSGRDHVEVGGAALTFSIQAFRAITVPSLPSTKWQAAQLTATYELASPSETAMPMKAFTRHHTPSTETSTCDERLSGPELERQEVKKDVNDTGLSQLLIECSTTCHADVPSTPLRARPSKDTHR
jgi:hypothetical protein